MTPHLRALLIAVAAAALVAGGSIAVVLTAGSDNKDDFEDRFGDPTPFFDDFEDFDEFEEPPFEDSGYFIAVEQHRDVPPSGAVLQLFPTEGALGADDPLAASVLLSRVPQLAGYHFDILYDDSLLSPTGVESTDFLTLSGEADECTTAFNDGRIAVDCSTTGEAACQDGTGGAFEDGVLMILRFTPERAGVTNFTFENVRFDLAGPAACGGGEPETLPVEAIGVTVFVESAR